MNSSNVTPAKRCQHGSTFQTYNYHVWFSKSLKRLKKIQWVGQPRSLFSCKVTQDPHVRAANWLCDAATHSNWDMALQAEGWLELPLSPDGVSGPARLDWREVWADELTAHPTFAWLLIHVGPEGLYKAANLSDGEAEVMRLKQEGHTQEQVAFLTGKSLGLVQNALSRGYAKVAALAGVKRPKRKRRLANSRQLPIEDPLTLAA